MALTVYTPEVFPTSVRGTAMGYCSSVARIGAIITPFVAQVCTTHYIQMHSCTLTSWWLHAYLMFKASLLHYTAALPGFSDAKVMRGIFLIVIFSSGLKMLLLYLSSTGCRFVSIVL